MRLVSVVCFLITTSANVQISVMLHAIFPSIARLPNVMGPGSSLDPDGRIGFALAWVAACFFRVIPVPKMKLIVYVKLIRLHHLSRCFAWLDF
jgi:cytosine/uracil/thiamine/allantoin permease